MSGVKQWPVYAGPRSRKAASRRQGRSEATGSASRGEAGSRRAARPGEVSWPVSTRSCRRPSTGATDTQGVVQAAASPAATPVTRGNDVDVRGVRTTGIFDVPSDTVIQLVVAISSFSSQAQPASVRILRVDRDELTPVFFRALTIPAGGAERIVVDGLGGERVQVDVTLPSDLLVPTVAVTQYFPADGGILVLVYKSPGDFVAV